MNNNTSLISTTLMWFAMLNKSSLLTTTLMSPSIYILSCSMFWMYVFSSGKKSIFLRVYKVRVVEFEH